MDSECVSKLKLVRLEAGFLSSPPPPSLRQILHVIQPVFVVFDDLAQSPRRSMLLPSFPPRLVPFVVALVGMQANTAFHAEICRLAIDGLTSELERTHATLCAVSRLVGPSTSIHELLARIFRGLAQNMQFVVKITAAVEGVESPPGGPLVKTGDELDLKTGVSESPRCTCV